MDVLLVEDSPEDTQLVRLLLTGENGGVDSLEVVGTLADALAYPGLENLDAIVLDLNLPDAAGVDAVVALLDAAPRPAIVVLTADDDRELTDEVLRLGAQDYLLKRPGSQSALPSVVARAVERQQRVVALLASAARKADAQAVAASLRRMQTLPAPSTATLYEAGPLRQRYPAAFDSFVDTYAEALEGAVEQRAYQVEKPVSPLLRGLASDMAFVSAGPRDIVELHTTTTARLVARASVEIRHATVAEGQLVLLELMGALATEYQRRARGEPSPGRKRSVRKAWSRHERAAGGH